MAGSYSDEVEKILKEKLGDKIAITVFSDFSKE
jgi:hypothetical protein